MSLKLILAFMCLATIVFSMCADEEPSKGTNETANSVTLKDITSNPSAYDGKTVLIKGVCSFLIRAAYPPAER
jgi:hypothetical protein